MEYSAQNKAAGQKNQGNNWMRTLHDQLNFFTGNCSRSESFDKGYNVSLFFIKKYVCFKGTTGCLIQEESPYTAAVQNNFRILYARQFFLSLFAVHLCHHSLNGNSSKYSI